MERKFDIILYGASGFTARFVIKELLRTNLKFALAGRSKQNIKSNILDIPNTKLIEIFEVSADQIETITCLTKVLLNVAGPYIFSGEKIVKSCINTTTHYLDITGETFFLEIIKKYDEEAKRKNVCIINCCGFDSIPADLGVLYLKNKIKEDSEILSVMKLKNAKLNYTTYQCLVYGLKMAEKTREMRKKGKGQLKKYFYNEETKSYNVIFFGSDPSVVKRTQNNLKNQNKKYSEYLAYFDVGNYFKLTMFKLFYLFLLLFSKFDFTTNLLLNYPALFTFNYVKKSRPNEVFVTKSSFEIYFFGKNKKTLEEKKLIISGPDPGYITTSICLVSAAEVFLKSYKNEGGVFTPGMFFEEKVLVEKLEERGLKFQIVE